jgi:hypothetical protein
VLNLFEEKNFEEKISGGKLEEKLSTSQAGLPSARLEKYI